MTQYADHIVVDVTEGQEPITPGALDDPLAGLTGVGYRLAIDDFGTGYSNLARLSRLKPDIIQIDRSLIVEATCDAGGPADLLRAAGAIADALHATAIVEGVEAQEQADLLLSLGIVQAQGYLYARPVPYAKASASSKSRLNAPAP